MKRTILLLIVLVGGAFYLGWFTFTTDESGNTEHVNIVIDKDKIRQDEARALEKLHALEQQAEEKGRAAPAALQGAAHSAGQNASSQAAVGRTADRRNLAQPPASYPPMQAAGYAAEPAPTGPDPYAMPEETSAARRSAAAREAESFSRGFQ